MTIFPNAKINIGLSILSRREDGYHDIETLFYPVGLKDALEFVTPESDTDSDELTVTGIDTGCRMQENIVVKALNVLRRKYNIPALQMHLHKVIPPGAGLGGGSSDAAFLLRYLNRYFRLGMCNWGLLEQALEVGSDCPFFIENRPVIATGRGEKMSPSNVSLAGYHIVIVYPGIRISTREAYEGSRPSVPERRLPQLLAADPGQWKDNVINDFEETIFARYPEIANLKEELYRNGAIYSSMSGSGSSVYGIFRDQPPTDLFKGRYWSWQGMLE